MSANTHCLIATAVLAISIQPMARAANESCPQSILEAATLLQEQSHWKTLSQPDERYLAAVAVYRRDESGEDLIILRPDETTRTKGFESDHWQLKPSSSESYWLGCSYDGTTALMAKALGDDIRHCAVQYSMLASGRRLAVKTVACR